MSRSVKIDLGKKTLLGIICLVIISYFVLSSFSVINYTETIEAAIEAEGGSVSVEIISRRNELFSNIADEGSPTTAALIYEQSAAGFSNQTTHEKAGVGKPDFDTVKSTLSPTRNFTPTRSPATFSPTESINKAENKALEEWLKLYNKVSKHHQIGFFETREEQYNKFQNNHEWMDLYENTKKNLNLHWVKDSKFCSDPTRKLMACSPHNYTFNVSKFYDSITACDLLQRLEIRKVLFLGDSFLRHFFGAFKIILSNNVLYGAVSDSPDATSNPITQSCMRDEGEGQFSEKLCRDQVLTPGIHCKGTSFQVDSSIEFTMSGTLRQNVHSNYDLIVWGIGNHPFENYGLVNYEAFRKILFPRTCPYNTSARWVEKNTKYPRTFWLPPHMYLSNVFTGRETRNNRRNFAMDTSLSIQEICGIPSLLETFYMTDSLVHTEIEELSKDLQYLTYDSYHWKRVVNVLKVQLLFNTLSREI